MSSSKCEKGAAVNGYRSDTYGVAKCVELYDAAVAPVAPAIAALLDSFQSAFLGEPAEEESGARHRRQFIDVGCGSGSFTLKHLIPRLPPWCEKLVAVDNSPSMLKFARENRSHPKIQYRELDMLADQDVAEFVQTEGRFQRVYSFLALHWIADHRHALRNIEALTAPGGECFLAFSNNLGVFDVFTAMLNSARWSKYSDVLLRVLPETRDMHDIGSLRAHLVNVVRATNLLPLACEVFRLTGDLGLDKDTALDFYCILNPVYPLLNDDERAELRSFTKDVMQDFTKRRTGIPIREHNTLVIHAFKPRE